MMKFLFEWVKWALGWLGIFAFLALYCWLLVELCHSRNIQDW